MTPQVLLLAVEILREAARRFDTTPWKLLQKTRTRRLARLRAVPVLVAYRACGLSFADLAAVFRIDERHARRLVRKAILDAELQSLAGDLEQWAKRSWRTFPLDGTVDLAKRIADLDAHVIEEESHV